MDIKKKYIIFYHREDNDGVFSGALFYDYITEILKYDITDLCFIGADYNEMEKFAKENEPAKLHEDFENIIITDVSFNAKYMKRLYKEFGNNMIWCDHHAPIIKASFENHFSDVQGIRDTQRSAILNVWKFLYDPFDEAYNKKNVPELLRILSAYDSWTYEKEGYDFDYVRNINKAVTFKYDLGLGNAKKIIHELYKVYVEREPSTMSEVYKDGPLIKELHELGKQLNEYDDKQIADIVKVYGDLSWEIRVDDKENGRPVYLKACALFHQGASNSTMFKSLKGRVVSQGIVFKHLSDGKWTMSLYNISNDEWLHCGEFLKERYNGGGHKGAAGCTLTETQFITILKNKTI